MEKQKPSKSCSINILAKPKIVLLVLLVAVLATLIFLQSKNYIVTPKGNTTEKLHAKIYLLEAKITDQQRLIQDASNKIQQISQFNDQNKTKFLIIKIYNLIQSAKFCLTIDKDPITALRLLTSANQELSAAADPALINIKNIIEQDIASLQIYTKVDILKTSLKIEFVNNELMKLVSPQIKFPTINAPSTTQKTDTKIPDTQNSSLQKTASHLFSRFLQQSNDILNKTFVIRTQTKSLKLEPEERYSLILNSELKLQIAEWALLHNQNDIYQNNIKEIADSLQSYSLYFPSTQIAPILKALVELQQIDLRPLPNLDNAEQAIKGAFLQ